MIESSSLNQTLEHILMVREERSNLRRVRRGCGAYEGARVPEWAEINAIGADAAPTAAGLLQPYPQH
jgi:hypothetical protein